MSMLYCAIASEGRVLCEQNAGPIKFGATARQQLGSSRDEYVAFAVGRNTYHSYNRNGLTFTAITDVSASQQQTLSFLRSLEAKFTANPTRVLEACSENCQKIDFRKELSAEMKKFNQQDQTKIMELQDQVDDVSRLMQKNIANLDKRGAKLDEILIKSEALEADAKGFAYVARKVKRRHCWKNWRIKIILAVVVFVLLLLIVLIILWKTGIFNWS